MSRSSSVKRNASSLDLEKKDKALSLAEQKQKAKEWSINAFSPPKDDYSPSLKKAATASGGGGAAGKKRVSASIEEQESVVEVKRARVTSKSKKQEEQILSPIAQSLKNFEAAHTPDDEEPATRFRPVSKQTPHPKKSRDTTPTLVIDSPPTVIIPAVSPKPVVSAQRYSPKEIPSRSRKAAEAMAAAIAAATAASNEVVAAKEPAGVTFVNVTAKKAVTFEEQKERAKQFRSSLSPVGSASSPLTGSVDEYERNDTFNDIIKNLKSFVESVRADPKLYDSYLDAGIMIFSAGVFFFVFLQLYGVTKSVLGHTTTNFLIASGLILGTGVVLWLRYGHYITGAPIGVEKQVKMLKAKVNETTVIIQRTLYDWMLMVCYTFAITVILSIGVTYVIRSVASNPSSDTSTRSFNKSIVEFIYTTMYVGITLGIAYISYYLYSSSTTLAKRQEQEVNVYAEKAKNFLIHIRGYGDDGVPSLFFIEEFLDSEKIHSIAKRQGVKKLWPLIEKVMLDDKRVRMTGNQVLATGSDYKYKYTKIATNTYTQPSAFMRTNSSSYSPYSGTTMGGNNISASDSSNKASRTRHHPNDPVSPAPSMYARTGTASKASTTTAVPIAKPVYNPWGSWFS